MRLDHLPPNTLSAVCTLLQPHAPDLSPTNLVRAIRDYDPSPSRSAERFLNKHEAAQVLCVSWHTVTKWARMGTVPSVRIGNCWKFPLSKLQALGDTQVEGDQ